MKNKNAPDLLIFTDLDGTLLDHETYSYDAALPAIKRLKELSIPLILTSSKTAAEISVLHTALELTAPAIVENGGGTWFPDGHDFDLTTWSAETERSRTDILDTLATISPDLRANFHGFTAMGVAEIMERTGLDEHSATNANERDWSEPGIWLADDESLSRFQTAASENGLKTIRGGRFIHLMGQTNKSKQMRRLTRLYQHHWNIPKVNTAALGDAPNDIEMLEAADHGYILPNGSGAPIPNLKGEASGQINRMSKPGPEGWNQAILGLLNSYQTEDA